MKVIIAECFSLLFKLTKSKAVSYIIALIFVTVLSFYVINGALLLLRDWLSIASLLLKFFNFPYSVLTMALLLGLMYTQVPRIQSLYKDAKKIYKFTHIIIYSVVGLLLFVYIHFGNSIFM